MCDGAGIHFKIPYKSPNLVWARAATSGRIPRPSGPTRSSTTIPDSPTVAVCMLFLCSTRAFRTAHTAQIPVDFIVEYIFCLCVFTQISVYFRRICIFQDSISGIWSWPGRRGRGSATQVHYRHQSRMVQERWEEARSVPEPCKIRFRRRGVHRNIADMHDFEILNF